MIWSGELNGRNRRVPLDFLSPLGGREIRRKVVYTSVMNTNSFPNVREKVPLAFCFPSKLYPLLILVNVDSSLELVLGKKRLRWWFFRIFLDWETQRCCCITRWILACSWIDCRSASLLIFIRLPQIKLHTYWTFLGKQKQKTCLYFCITRRSSHVLQSEAQRAHGNTLHESISCRARCSQPLSKQVAFDFTRNIVTWCDQIQKAQLVLKK